MLTFLRKIRKSLIESGSAQKYALYAIGEIALVVIGILIALQINNWNEWRKDRQKEKIILGDIAKNLKINIQTFKDDIQFLYRGIESGNIVLTTLQNNLPYHDSLKVHFHQARVTKRDLFISNVGYQSLKDNGLDIISNKSLSDEIFDLYEVKIPGILSTNSLVNNIQDSFDNHIVQNFTVVAGEGLTPNDYNSLLSDHYYISWIRAHKEGRKYLIYADQKLIGESERVLQLIKDELGE